jgi:outer membrane protein assembly factor BamB
MRSIMALCISVIAVAASRADDWPQWMGPKRDNVWREKGIMESLPKDGPKVLWRAKVANGYSGPAVADGCVFLTDFVADGDLQTVNGKRKSYPGKERVLCFDAKSGKLNWKHEYDCTYSVSYPNGPRCTPTYEAGKLYTLGAEGNLICFEAKTGKVLWSREFKKDYNIESPFWGFAGHPLIDGDRLICLVGGEGSVAVALDKTNGKEIWKALSATEPGYSPPTLIEAGGVRQLLIWHPEALNSLDPKTGKVHWSVAYEAVNGTSIMTPQKLGDFLYVGSWSNRALLLKLDADKAAVTTLWKGNRDNGVFCVNGTPFLENGHIYGVCSAGELRCVNIKTGERAWSTLKPVGGKKVGTGTAHLVKNGERFFLFAETGHLLIAKLSPKGYDEISRWQMLEPTSKAFGRDVAWSPPAFAQQCVFARNDKEMVCVSLAK